MSGLEVAGLILGRLPLVISALEYYQSSLSILKYRSEKSEIREVEHSLKYRQTLFHTTVELLLHQFLEPAEIQELLSDPTGSKWQNKSVDLALRESIGHDEYILFSDTTKQLFEALSSLQESLRKITDGSKANRLLSRSNLRWALSKDTTRDAVNKIEGQTEILRTLVLYSSLPKPHEIRQVIQNIKTAIKGVPEFEDLTRNLQHFTSCTICIPPDADVDVRSLYSVESEIDGEKSSLSYLPLSLQAVNDPQRNAKEEALLDTGATACAISITIALKLNLSIEETEETVVKTAALEELPVAGQVHLNLRWKDDQDKKFGTRMWVYVVSGLTHPMLLSHDFTQKHPEVWSIAKTVIYLPRQLNVLWFNKLSEKQKRAEDEYRARCLQRNTARADAEKQERLSEQDRLLASSAQSSTAGSSTSGSTSGSSSVSTSASTNATNNLSGTLVPP